MIAPLGRWYDRLPQRVGQTMAGAVVFGSQLSSGSWSPEFSVRDDPPEP